MGLVRLSDVGLGRVEEDCLHPLCWKPASPSKASIDREDQAGYKELLGFPVITVWI